MMNFSVQLIFVILLTILIGNGKTKLLNFWYTGKDLNCRIHSVECNERPFDIDVYPFWQYVQNEYCTSEDGTVIKINKNEGNQNDCMESDFRTLEMDSENLNLAEKLYRT